jgi:RTX calcium-binding nonapeptide repeat (4 copies)
MGWFKRAGGKRLGITFVVGCAAGAILSAGSASAAVTIGSNLQHEPNNSFNCSDLNRCTVMLSALEPARQAPGGVVSPIDGVLVSWSIRVGDGTEPITFRVIRPSGAVQLGPTTSQLFVGAASVPEVTPPLRETTTYPARVAVRAGDGIGFDCCQMGIGWFWNDAGANPGGEPFFAPNGSTYRFWNPILADGGSPLAPTATQGPEQYETAIQARIETDCDKDGLGDETQDTNPSATCTGLPATPATIVGTDGNDVLSGTPGKDVILGLGGKDKLLGNSGNDMLKGGKGKDTLLGQKDNDALKGGPGRDLCKGGKGKDTASGCETEKSI